MNVVIVGAWNRSESADYDLVSNLLEQLRKQHPTLLVVTAGCGRGIGKIVRNKCMPREHGKRHPEDFDFVEVAVRVYSSDLGRMRLAQIWAAQNAMLVEAGEEFHLFMDNYHNAGSQMDDLLRRVRANGLKHSVYQPGEVTGPKLIRY